MKFHQMNLALLFLLGYLLINSLQITPETSNTTYGLPFTCTHPIYCEGIVRNTLQYYIYKYKNIITIRWHLTNNLNKIRAIKNVVYNEY